MALEHCPGRDLGDVLDAISALTESRQSRICKMVIDRIKRSEELLRGCSVEGSALRCKQLARTLESLRAYRTRYGLRGAHR